MGKTDGINIGGIVLKKLAELDRSTSWLARKIEHDASNLKRILDNNDCISCNLLFSISKALDEDFFAHYSKELNK